MQPPLARSLPPTFALSTHWNAFRHSEGETLVEEILKSTGISTLELGYDLTLDLVPGVIRMVREGAVRVNSVHSYCPVPVGAPQGHPELWALASRDRRVRESAVRHLIQTAEFATQVGARVMVCHGGNVEMRQITRKLVALIVGGRQYTPKFERLKMKLIMRREKRVKPYLEHLAAGIEQLLPELEKLQVAIAFENLPTWEAIPTEIEAEALCRRFNSPWVRYWHDIGHGQIRQNLGLSAQKQWIARLSPFMAGLHVHDVIPPAHDHVMPPDGTVDFAALAPVIPADALKVIEPAPGTPPQLLRDALVLLTQAWTQPPAAPADAMPPDAVPGESPAVHT